MQSDRNSSCGGIFFECVNMALKEEDKILDQIYEMLKYS